MGGFLETIELVDQAFAHGMIQVREEIVALVDLLRTRPVKNVMEIGSESGGTFYLWCRLATLGGLKISVDLPWGDSGSGQYRNPEKLAARTALFQSWAPRVKVVTGDSHERKTQLDVADLLDGDLLDFLFIDGDHSYDGVKADWETYREFVRPGGLVAFHDINQGEYMDIRGCQVGRLWAELLASGLACQEFNQKLHWAGIGVVTV